MDLGQLAGSLARLLSGGLAVLPVPWMPLYNAYSDFCVLVIQFQRKRTSTDTCTDTTAPAWAAEAKVSDLFPRAAPSAPLVLL